MFRRGREDRPNGVFPIGTRVEVQPGLSWDHAFTGTIAEPSPAAVGFGGWQGWWRMMQTERGTFRSYWVVFDEPQPDPDEPGHYTEAEVDERFLERIR
jgi:hypothetical protein